MFNQASKTRLKSKKYWILFPVLFIAAALLLGWVVMSLWNAILPEVLGVNTLNFQQALGLFVLCRILFGGFRGGGRRHRRPPFGQEGKPWMGMNEEERAQFKASWKERCRQKKD